MEEVLGLHSLASSLMRRRRKTKERPSWHIFFIQSSLRILEPKTKMLEFWFKKKRPRKLITRSISDYVISSIACFAFSSGEMVSLLFAIDTQMYLIVCLRYTLSVAYITVFSSKRTFIFECKSIFFFGKSSYQPFLRFKQEKKIHNFFR